MRTTVRIPNALHRRAIDFAHASGSTLQAVLEESLEQRLDGVPDHAWTDAVTDRPWPEDLAVPVAAGDHRVIVNGAAPRMAIRILSEANYRHARRCVNRAARPVQPGSFADPGRGAE